MSSAGIPVVAKRDILTRLSRVEGQIRGVARLVETDHDCEKVLQQLTAARKALDKTFVQVIAGMMDHCMSDAGETHAKRKARMSDMIDLLTKYG